MTKAIGILYPDDLAGNAADTRDYKHRDGEASRHDQQMVAIHRREKGEKPRTESGVADTVRISRQCKKWEDRGDTD